MEKYKILAVMPKKSMENALQHHIYMKVSYGSIIGSNRTFDYIQDMTEYFGFL